MRLYRTESMVSAPEATLSSSIVMVLGTKETRVVNGKSQVSYSFEGLDPLKVGIPVDEINPLALFLALVEAQEDDASFKMAWERRNETQAVVLMKTTPPSIKALRSVDDIKKAVFAGHKGWKELANTALSANNDDSQNVDVG
jgi:hypothetical protein